MPSCFYPLLLLLWSWHCQPVVLAFTCNDGCGISDLTQEDGFCDCSECEDESDCNCDSCVGGCSQQYQYTAQYGATMESTLLLFTTSTTASSRHQYPHRKDDESFLSKWKLYIVIGCPLVLVICCLSVAVCLWLRRKRRNSQVTDKSKCEDAEMKSETQTIGLAAPGFNHETEPGSTDGLTYFEETELLAPGSGHSLRLPQFVEQRYEERRSTIDLIDRQPEGDGEVHSAEGGGERPVWSPQVEGLVKGGRQPQRRLRPMAPARGRPLQRPRPPPPRRQPQEEVGEADAEYIDMEAVTPGEGGRVWGAQQQEDDY